MSFRNASAATVSTRPSVRRFALSLLAFLLVGFSMIVGGRSMSAATPPKAAPAKSLIYAGWFGSTLPTPSYIAANLAFLESQPFNGLTVYMRNSAGTTNVSTAIMTPNPVSQATISSVLAPMAGLPFSNLRDNFATVFGSSPPDFFDNWSVTIQNYSNLAAAIRDAGLRGVVFDNEQYFSPWGDYPTGVDYPTKTLAQYQAQATLRGRQCMEAMVAQFPDIVVLTLHGPYISEMKAPTSLGFPTWQSGNELLGPFFAGFQEGSIFPGQNVDGGELYDRRTAEDFEEQYQWRRHGMPSPSVNCPFLSPETRATWADNVSLSWGVYDRPFWGQAMNPAVLTTTLTNALQSADQWVWFYAEQATFLRPPSQGGASQAWIDSIRAALPAGEAPSTRGPFMASGGSSGGGGGSGGRCGLLGMEVVPIFLGLLLIRKAAKRSPSQAAPASAE